MNDIAEALNGVVQTLKQANNEATRAPYWLIIDPKQNMDCNPHAVAFNLAGPFFCREDAEGYLKSRRYNYSKRAVVYCCSGHHSSKYEQLCASLGKI